MAKRRFLGKGRIKRNIQTTIINIKKLLDDTQVNQIGEKLGLDGRLKERFSAYCSFINQQLGDFQLKGRASFGWMDRDGGKQYYRIFIGGVDQPHFLDRQENRPLLYALNEIGLSSGFTSVEFQGSCYTGSIILKE